MNPFRRPPRRRSFSVSSSNQWRARPIVEVLEDRLTPAIFTVNDPGDGGTFSGTSGDLRYCIEQANAAPDLDTIVFDLPGVGIQTIQPLSALPTIVHPVNIDGYTQTGASPNTLTVGSDAVLLIELNGSQTGAGVNGLTITGTGSKISGLIINGFGGYGVAVVGPATFNTVAGNYIGTDHSGTSAVPNALGGVGVLDNTARFTFIGGEPAPARNLISGNTGPGVFIAGPDTIVQNNYVGTDASGTTALGNEAQGVVVSATTGVTIGGLGTGNLISGNAGAGVRLFDAVGNLIQGNLIGLDATGTNKVHNLDGVRVEGDSSNNVIGFNSYAETVLNDDPLVYYRLGEAAGATTAVNLGSLGSAANGTYQGSVGLGTTGALVGDADTAATFDATGVDRVSTNPIAFPTTAFTAEVWMQSTTPGTESALISYAVSAGGRDNEFLLLYSGGEFVIYIRSANDNAGNVATGVGGTFDGDWHHLAVTWFGETGDLKLYVDGVERFSGVLQAGTTLTSGGSLVLGQDQDNVGGGFDAAQAYLGNLDEFALYDQPLVASEIQAHYLAGSNPEAARNVIGGNTNAGVVLNGANVTANRVTTNFIGTSADGTTALGNGSDGVYLTAGANGNTIGGLTLTPGTILGNVVSGNDVHGVHLDGTAGGSNLIQGNILGLAADGNTDISSGIGIRINRGTGNVVGGTDVRARNIISGHTNGVVLSASGSALNTLIQNNYVGTDITGSLDRGNSTGINVGSAPGTLVVGNVVSGNVAGVEISNTSQRVIGGLYNALVQGNLIGLSADGTTALGNATGILLLNDDNLIGGTTATTRNIISGNTSEGLRIALNAAGNVVQGNYIGTNVAGTAALGNLRGVLIENGASNNTIGGNVISGNTANDTLGTGIHIDGATTTGNVVQGNLIGLGADGTTLVGNAGPGVQILDAPSNTIGGTATGAGNTIAGNRSGVGISGGSATGNLIQGNFIGTNAAGTADRGNLNDGLAITGATGNTIAGNVVSGNDGRGIVLGNGADTNLIQGNRIGTNAAGTADLGNTLDGIFVQGDSNTIGGTLATERNIISGNDRFGVQIRAGAHGNMVLGNYIGTDVNGTVDLGNTSHGVQIGDATNNTIGGNVISGNDGAGVRVASAAADGNVLSSNFIGTNAAGSADLGNSSAGLLIEAGSANTTVGALNLISGNGDAGILVRDATTTGVLIQGNFIGTDVTGANDLGNDKEGIRVETGADGVIIGGTVAAERNVVSGNNEGGIRLQSANNVVQGNYIGLKADGLTGRPNISSDALRGFGIEVTGADNLIGGATSAPGTEAGNVIASNGQGGVGAAGVGVWVRGVSGTRIEGNLISLNQNGGTPGGFQQFGVLLSEGATNTVIGGTDAGVRNVIAGSGTADVELRDETTTANVVQGNYIGTNPAGSASIGGTNYGVHLNDSGGNLIGGTTPEARNLISGLDGDGIRITNNGSSPSPTIIQGNWIGLDATGTLPLPNKNNGIVVLNSRNNLIGGTTPGAGNVISGGAASPNVNGGNGINLAATSNRNTVQGNFIGTDSTGTLDVGNKTGIRIRQDLASRIGGTMPGAGNIIAGNDDFGILVTFTPSRGQRIQGNWIGLNVNGDVLPNGVGVQLENGADGNLVGVRGYDGEVFSELPRLYWRLDEQPGATTAINRGTLGAAADGTYLGSVALGEMGALAGDANTAARFGDTNNEAVLDTTFGMYTAAFSLEAWVLSGSSAAQQTIVSYAVSGSSNEFALISTNNELGIYLNSNSDAIDGVTSVNTGVDVLDGQWHHLVVSWVAGSGALMLYKDGVEVYSGTLQAGNNLSTNGTLVLAQDQDSLGGGFDPSQRFIGTLDEVVFTGFLDDVDVAGDYAAGAFAGGQNVISGNATDGVVITGGQFTAHDNVIAGNFIGTDPTGSSAKPNGADGIQISGGAHDNLIGGTTTAARNLISGNGSDGVEITGAGTTANRVVANSIGTDVTGLSDLGNSLIGVRISVGAGGNFLGGATAGEGNLVSGNDQEQISIAQGAAGNTVQGNWVGLDATGFAAISGGSVGIGIDSANNLVADNVIGGVNVGIVVNNTANLAGPLANTIQGNRIGTNVAGTDKVVNSGQGIRVFANAHGNLIGTDGDGSGDGAEGNLISGNNQTGLFVESDDNVIAGNLIGLDVFGTTILGNGQEGVVLSGANNTVGGLLAAQRNVISGNVQAGIQIDTATAHDNVILGNYIGTDVTGTVALGNGVGNSTEGGVFINGAANNIIGGTTAAARNIIAGDSGAGVLIVGAGATGNVVLGNYIGLDVMGTVALPNDFGVRIQTAAAGNTIGGTTPDKRNVISGNSERGIAVAQAGSGNAILGNFIGPDATGTATLSNLIGITIFQATNTDVIGNVVSGNASIGIQISSDTGTTVQGNLIGTNPTGSAVLGGQGNGLIVESVSNNLMIGGTTAGTGNVISGHGNGIVVSNSGGAPTGLVVQGNRIGTDLAGTVALANTTGIDVNLVAAGLGTLGLTIADNLISGNDVGVRLRGSAKTTGVVVVGNFIGTDAAGTTAIPNLIGVEITEGATANFIGGTTPQSRNLISGNTNFGVYLGGVSTTGNQILGNYIGLDTTGTVALGTADGVHIAGATNNQIGNGAGGGNVIAGNSVDISVFGNDAVGNKIQGNIISADATGTTSIPPSFAYGILLSHGASNNLIGTDADGNADAGERNIIAVGSIAAIFIEDIAGQGTQTGNVIAGNYIGLDPTGTAYLGNAVSGRGVWIQGGVDTRIGTNADGVNDAVERNVIAAGSGSGVGILITKGTGTTIAGNYIGTDASGTVALGGGGSVGVQLMGQFGSSVTGTTIGGMAAAARNVISGHGLYGVEILYSGATGNSVQGNFIGTDASGTADLGNGQIGVYFFDAGGNTVADNVISGNDSEGIRLEEIGTTNTLILGNLIGTDATGLVALGNGGAGISLVDAPNNRIGGATAGARNVISGNGFSGVRLTGANASDNRIAGNYIGLNAAGTAALGNIESGVVLVNAGTGNVIGGTTVAERNVISGNRSGANTGAGVLNSDTAGTVVIGNYIGTNAAGTASVGNEVYGVLTSLAAQIGTDGDGVDDAAEGNLISGNGFAGILIGGSANDTENVVVAGNRIGTNAAGTADLVGHGTAGVLFATLLPIKIRFNRIGTNFDGVSDDLESNLISGSGGAGVLISGTTAAAMSENVVAGNLIVNNGNGVEITGGATDNRLHANTIVGNLRGVLLSTDALGNFVGTDGDDVNDDSEGNLISGNVNGIVLENNADNNVIAGNRIGTNAAGSAAQGNTNFGIHVADATVDGTLIGSNGDDVNDELERNVISGNAVAGINDLGTGTLIAGNYIGTDAAGTSALGVQSGIAIGTGATGTSVTGNLISGNLGHGLGISGGSTVSVLGNVIGLGADGSVVGNRLGGAGGGAGVWVYNGAANVNVVVNVISGNQGDGVLIQDASTNNVVVAGNLIGTDILGTTALGNVQAGVHLKSGASGHTIGGDSPEARNIISGNLGDGVLIQDATTKANAVIGNYIGVAVSGDATLNNGGSGVHLLSAGAHTIGGGPEHNLISGNGADGIDIDNTAGAVIVGNWIGLNADGSAALGNLGSGIRVRNGAANVRIGTDGDDSDDETEGNVISGNGALPNGHGITLTGSGHVVAGNRIGTDPSGTVALGNRGNGILVTAGAHDNLIGGFVPTTMNVISGNLLNGVRLTGSGTTNNQLAGNHIGTDVFGTQELNNAEDGVHIDGGATGNIIGGDEVEERNLISGNAGDGVEISGSVTLGNVVSGNYIGLDASGTGDLGNGVSGVLIHDAAGNLIGGTTETERNVIAGNDGPGVHITGTNASANEIQGNFIGIDANGAALGQQSGVLIDGGAVNNVVGGQTATPGVGAGNVIGGNVEGVSLNQSGAGNVVQGNIIGGADALANVYGVVISSAAGNLIGGGAAGAANVIDGNSAYGVFLQAAGTSGNKVQGNRIGVDVANFYGVYVLSVDSPNFIGTDSNGTNDAAEGNLIANNSGAGVVVLLSSSLAIAGNQIEANANVGVQIQDSPTTLGGLTTAARNVISGNLGKGVLIQGALSAGTVVLGNFIGTDATGSNAQGNSGSGVQIQGGATGVTIGGTTAQARNVISSNENGVVIADTATDNLVVGNLVSGNTVSGVLIQDAGTTGNKVQGNDVLNNPIGVFLFAGADGNFVGVDGDEVNDAAERNVISGNVTGVYLQTDTADNVIAGNFIGTSADGTAALGNEVGIAIFDATTSGTRIGTNADGKSDILERNVIAGNSVAGILDSGTDTLIVGNYVGTDAAGLTALGVQSGVVIANGATGTRIEANLISGNLGHGIGVSGADITIAANVIGLAADGTALGNLSGVWIYGSAAGVTVGGATTAARNTISGNDGAGVLIEDDSTNVTVEGNFIGTDATGELDRGNAGDGVNVTGGVNALLRGNVLSGNAGFGVALGGTGTTLAGNRIGSDKDGTTSIPNDAGDVMLGGSGNMVGGTVAAARNVFLGSLKIEGADNVVQGNTFGLMADGATAVTSPGGYGIEVSGPRNLIGGATSTPGTGVGNVISGNGLDNPGIWIHSETSTGTRVEGNVIGLSVAGAFVGHQSYGVLLSDGATGVTIGGLNPGTSNVIAGNLVANVELRDETTTGNVVQGNLIGTNMTGMAAITNTNFGVHLNGAVGNLIGGTDVRARNVISGQGMAGVRVAFAQDNVIQGNWIGLAADGTSVVANLQAGIELDNSMGTLIGGNVVSGGAMGAGLGIGIDFNNTSFENVVQGNFIGTNADGTTARGNKIGIRLNESLYNLIGGTDPYARNIVSGNDGPGLLLQSADTFGNEIQGNWIGLDAAGADLGNNGSGILIEAGAVDNLIGGGAVGAGNVISGNAEHGVEIAGVGSSANTIRGNFIGVNSMGCVALPNDGSGILIHDGADVNFIGGPLPEHRNVISGNLEGGVTLASEFNIVEGNYIGLHSDGLSAIPNLGTGPFGGYGIAVSAAGNIIENNVVSGNGAGGGPEVGVGVWIDSAASAGTIVAGNLIGTDAFGTRSLGQQSYGVLLTDGATDILIGGEDAANANVISGNGNVGIRVTQSDFNLIQGNLIGTDKSGTVARPNANAGILVDRSSGVAILDNVVSGGGSGNPDGLGVGIRLANQTTEAELLGNFIGTTKSGTGDLGNKIGIEIVDSSMNLIGGLGPLDSNVISGNDDFGIVLSGSGTQSNDIAGNLIGLGMGGSDVGNSDAGVLFQQGARENSVVANFIANNGKGVVLRDASTQGNRILGNSIFNNDTVGIDIGDDGVTPNGVSGPVGPNGNQTFPDITAAAEVGTTATVTGSLLSSANMAFTIEFFANTTADPSNHGEGELFLGAVDIGTNADGVGTFSFTFTTTPEMRFVTATATNPAGNTSEFSEVQMLAPPQVVVDFPGDLPLPFEQPEVPRRIPSEATTPLLNPIFTPPVPVDTLLPRVVEEPFEIAFIRETGGGNDAAPLDPGAGQTRTVVAPSAREADPNAALPEVQPEVQATKVITNTVDGDDSVRLFEELIRSNGGQETSAPVAPKKVVPPDAPKPQPAESKPTPPEESSRATVIPEPAHAEIPSPLSLRKWLALPATFATISWLWWDAVRRRPRQPLHSPRSKRASLEVRELQ